ncbi:MAG: hypothetical protein M1812_000577 [Candelaria pacifica]|nr:MAG: hypothetical protein M1812_000577 [Candelaria pacifica]
MASTPISPLQAGVEMFQKGHGQPFFKASAPAPRPLSEATEIYDTEFEEDLSDTEEANSPRLSVESFGKKSDTTLSSYDELQTPNSNTFTGFNFQLEEAKPVEGPRGPHLFRISHDSSSQDVTFHMSMSPLSPKNPPPRMETAFRSPPVEYVPQVRPISTLTEAVAQMDTAEVRNWSPRQVAVWMYSSGFEDAVVEKFRNNDITGAILVDLQFEDLKELDIQSFGKRHRLWNEIHNLRGNAVPNPTETPFEDLDRPCSNDSKKSSRSRRHSPRSGDCASDEDLATPSSSRRRRNRKHRRHGADDVISPAESVSIVAIEQLLPKPHKCSKGENCSKYRKQQRQLARLAQEHPISPEKGGQIFIAGNPGNPATAEDMLRPTSEVVPSVVASSDVLGPAQYPAFKLEEEKLREVESRDPQENVKQFLTFQHMHCQPEEPTTPPLEMFPSLQPLGTTPAANENLRRLPKLMIPPPRSASANNATFSPSRTITPSNVYRHGTPCSEMDVPVTAIPLGPVARDFSQSVPPDMRYRQEGDPVSRSASRAGYHGRRPSFVMARVDEQTAYEDMQNSPRAVDGPEDLTPGPGDYNHAGWMKKRKTKLLRHEWHEHHFTLKGTKLAMHKDEKNIDALEYIDVDDYAVACSSLASNKLGAAFKSMRLSGKKKDGDVTAFTFQLIPGDKKGASSGMRSATVLGGKTHHFAVRNRDERIDWMRELMLAKALKQKEDGAEMGMNGNMI